MVNPPELSLYFLNQGFLGRRVIATFSTGIKKAEASGHALNGTISIYVDHS